MPLYRLAADAFIAGHRHRKGALITFDGPAGQVMIPVVTVPAESPLPGPPPSGKPPARSKASRKTGRPAGGTES